MKTKYIISVRYLLLIFMMLQFNSCVDYPFKVPNIQELTGHFRSGTPPPSKKIPSLGKKTKTPKLSPEEERKNEMDMFLKTLIETREILKFESQDKINHMQKFLSMFKYINKKTPIYGCKGKKITKSIETLGKYVNYYYTETQTNLPSKLNRKNSRFVFCN